MEQIIQLNVDTQKGSWKKIKQSIYKHWQDNKEVRNSHHEYVKNNSSQTKLIFFAEKTNTKLGISA